jgi:hypothetical protein
MPNQQDLNSYDFQENPFAALMGDSGQQQPQPTGGMSGGMPAGQMTGRAGGMPGGQMGGGEEGMEEEENQYNKGQNPDRGKPLMSAIQALENYITQSTERDEILTARGIISLLTKLVAKDQESMMKQ